MESLTNKYTCAACNRKFVSTWSDEEAAEEARKNFAVVDTSDLAVVCDDCYQLAKPEMPS